MRYDTDAGKIVVTAAVGDDSQAEPQIIEYTYGISGDQLTLTGSDDRTVTLQKRSVVEDESTREGPPVP